jgi:hypothetical protein
MIVSDLSQYSDYVEWLITKGYLSGFKVKVDAKVYGIDGILYEVDTIGYMPKVPDIDTQGRAYVAFLTGYGPCVKGRFTLCGANIAISKLLSNVIEYPKEGTI